MRAQNRNAECKQTQNSAKRGRNGTVKRKKKECMRQKKKELWTHTDGQTDLGYGGKQKRSAT